ncbi:hypothetical protein [Neisseria dumasiana]|uniref:Uncharacterized protein n=1 Tax=Neisseria dumasiana TaxID=1931275 RepID=A0A1X3DL16_9NEIS|nr:hypothetical protein [Neisseria dumasiana]OSI25076.1 hypothetical protein BV912_01490 [Neisseria dumasiana]
MTLYRELVQRVVAAKHADLELGLGRAREQESFVLQVSRLLDKTSWEYTVRMDNGFNVTFNMELGLVDFEHQIRAVWQTVAAMYCVHRAGNALEVGSRLPEGYTCRIVFGDVP